ncbi:acetylserotonin O-methyltransferase [Mesorhizobium sp. M0293]|uniref:methyltransferase n=1 Tax=unclassified Mesorhizobium TaxID=325217 RepID=UPI00333BFCC9
MDASISAAVRAETAEQAKAVEPSPDRIMRLGFGFRGAKALLSAVELDLFSHLAVAPLDGETLRQRLGLHQRGARDFFDALVALGMIDRCSGIYSNTPETDFYLDRSKPSYIGGILRLADTMVYPVWNSLTEALRTGEPHSGIKDGQDLFDFAYSDPPSLARFAQGMTGSSLPVATALAQCFPWTDYRTFIDVGAAEGAAAVEIAKAHPHLTGGGFDLPKMQPLFEAYVQSRRVEDRLRFHAGDFFSEPLPSADVLVMGQILHDWGLKVKQELLSKAFAALPNGGALIVYDQMIDDERRENAAGLLMSLNMLVGTRGGFDYTHADATGWMRCAGFGDVRHAPLTSSHSMIVGRK